MPYASINELPENVRHILPKHAQEIYKEAFKSAYEQYAKPEERRDNAGHEETVHRIAWSAVKKGGYAKGEDDKWHKS